MAPKQTTAPKTPESLNAGVRSEPRTCAVVAWNPERIRQAEISCACGNYMLAADICEDMFSDDRVSLCLDRLYAATTLPLTFQLPGVDAEASKADPICQALEYDFWKMFPEQVLRDMAKWAGSFFAVLGHIDRWEKDEETGRVLPKISVWSPRSLRSDPELGWVVRCASSSGDYWGTEERITPGDGNWILIVFGSSYRAPYQAPWRAASRWWLLGKIYAPIDWSSSSERHGQGIGVATNTSANPVKTDATQRNALANKLHGLGRNAVAVMPEGWQFSIESDAANVYGTFKSQKEAADAVITFGYLGTNLTSEVTGGSYSAAQVHESIDASKLRSFLELLATGIREQVLVHWHRFNFGSGVAPYPHWDTTPPKDKKAESDARKSDADAFNAYVSAGAQIDQIAWFEGKVQLIPGATQEIKKPAPDVATAPSAPNPFAPNKSKALALGDSSIRAAAAAPTAFERGREYTDQLEGECVAHAAKKLAPTVASVLSAISEATDYEDAKARILAAYGDALPVTTLVRLTESALIMAQLAGVESVNQEVDTGE